ncbi:glycosyltransferase [Marinivivus vitaminiproducens]|uniref:glycosyltransferase n=1 Tax=Marinivivus vitaminiproducens TaxID=3035935 RepID=UPI002798922A|nr:glycosyltransferase [Geminicoccaceae bacterium SCSIO 64248]
MSIEQPDIPARPTLDEYARAERLAPMVDALRDHASEPVRALRGRTVWMISSTAAGGGVAETLPRVVAVLRELGVRTEWRVIQGRNPAFFTLTKRVHNMLHGRDEGDLTEADRELFARESAGMAEELAPHVGPDDIVVIHDPQPAAVGDRLQERLGVPTIWRCHVGLERSTPSTDAAWRFLEPHLRRYGRTLFTLRDYVPDVLEDRASVLPPSIDPLSHKNRDLDLDKLTGILRDAGLLATEHPAITLPFGHRAERLQPDGTFGPATSPDDIGLLFRPIVLQVSRWDRLKGFAPLLEGFARLKASSGEDRKERHRRRVDHARLVLAGPDPTGVQDDPEAAAVLEELCSAWRALPEAVRRDIVLLRLPMASRKQNGLMVNALQRCACVVVQNSLQEGFGLTVTEALWKERTVLGSQAAGIRAQIEDGRTGRLVADAEDPEQIAAALDAMLSDEAGRAAWGRNGRDTVARRFLIFAEVQGWLEVLAKTAAPASS